MSDTPRVDMEMRQVENLFDTSTSIDCRLAVKLSMTELARQLERELADKNKQLSDYIDTVAAMCFAARGGECDIETLEQEMHAVSTKPSEFIRHIIADKDKRLAEARAEIERLKAEMRDNNYLAARQIVPAEMAVDDLRAEIERKDRLIEQMREALQWYKEQVSSCNRNGDAGELARDRLAKDVGKRAEAALSAVERETK